MNKRIAYVSVVYPAAKKYLDEFLSSLERQTYKDFDVVIVNDSLKDFPTYAKKYPQLRIKELESKKSPAENRKAGMDYAKDNGYEYVILGDADDYEKDNRIECIAGLLDKYDIVVNDLDLIDEHSSVIKEAYMSARLNNLDPVELRFIEDKNIFGFGNSALRAKWIGQAVFDNRVISADWLFFTSLLMKGAKAVFTNETITYHRLHQLNLIGLGTFEKEDIQKALRSKILHYERMAQLNNKYSKIFEQYQSLNELLAKDEDSLQDYVQLMRRRNINNPLWLEEVQPGKGQ